MSNQLKNLLGDSIIYGLGSFILKATQVLILPLILFYLKPDEFGVLDYFLNIKNIIIMVYGWGILTSIFKFTNTEAAIDKGPFNGFLVALSIILVSSVILGILLLFKEIRTYALELLMVHIIASFGALLTIPLGIFRQKRMPFNYILINAMYTVMFIGISYLLITTTNLSYLAILWGHILGNTVAFIYGAIKVKKFVDFKFDRDLFKKMFHFGFSILLNQMAFVVILGITRFILKSHGSFEDVGILGMAFRLSLFVGALLIAPFSLAWLPFISANKNKDGFNKTLNSTFRIFSWVGLLFVLILELFLRDGFLLIKNKEYLVALKYVLPFSLSFLFQGLYFIFAAGIFLSGRVKEYKIIAIAGILMNLILYLIFMNSIDISSVTIITLLSFIWMFLLAYFFGNKTLKIKIFTWANGSIYIFYSILLIIAYNLPENTSFSWMNFSVKLFGILILVGIHVFAEKKLTQTI